MLGTLLVQIERGRRTRAPLVDAGAWRRGSGGRVRGARALRCCCGLEEKTEEELLSCGLDRGKEEELMMVGRWNGRSWLNRKEGWMGQR